jgi:signal transduction histidine kinase
LKPIAQRYGILLILELPAKSVQVLANPLQVIQVIEGLLVHSLRFGSPTGQRALHLELTGASTAHVQLNDKEATLDEKQLLSIFEKSSQLSGVSTRFVGLGIGLPLAKEIISSHAGKIWATSKPGEGVTYHFTLPLAGG